MTSIPTRSRTAGREAPAVAEAQVLERGVAIGRDGQPIRRIKSSADKYAISPEILARNQADGWVYQWKRHTVLNQEDPTYAADLFRAGWRPVPAERHPGEWGPKDMKGSIIVGGQMLMERPLALDIEARAEEHEAAARAVNSSREQFGFAPTAKGFEGADTSNNPSVRKNSFARTGRENVELNRPKYDYSVDE
jgi:hypothetical protein